MEIGYIDFKNQFSKLSFAKQVNLVARIINELYTETTALLVGRSFGGWILLNALMQRNEIYPGTVVLIASVLGYGFQSNLGFIAPRAKGFWLTAESNMKPPARSMALIHSTADRHCPFELASKLCDLWGLEVIAVPNGGHDLGKNASLPEVSEAIRSVWFESSKTAT